MENITLQGGPISVSLSSWRADGKWSVSIERLTPHGTATISGVPVSVYEHPAESNLGLTLGFSVPAVLFEPSPGFLLRHEDTLAEYKRSINEETPE